MPGSTSVFTLGSEAARSLHAPPNSGLELDLFPGSAGTTTDGNPFADPPSSTRATNSDSVRPTPNTYVATPPSQTSRSVDGSGDVVVDIRSLTASPDGREAQTGTTATVTSAPPAAADPFAGAYFVHNGKQYVVVERELFASQVGGQLSDAQLAAVEGHALANADALVAYRRELSRRRRLSPAVWLIGAAVIATLTAGMSLAQWWTHQNLMQAGINDGISQASFLAQQANNDTESVLGAIADLSAELSGGSRASDCGQLQATAITSQNGSSGLL